MDLYQRIQDLKKEKKIRDSEMAHALDMEQSNYVRVEKKGVRLTYEQIEKIATGLGVSVKELLFDEKEDKTDSNLVLKENEDLRKENEVNQQKIENLRLQVENEKLLRISTEDRINTLCWRYIITAILGYRDGPYNLYYCNSELFKDIINEIFPNDKAVGLFVEKNKIRLESYKKRWIDTVGTGYYTDYDVVVMRLVIDEIDDKKKFKKYFLQEIEKKIRRPLENEDFMRTFFFTMAQMDDNYYDQLLFCVEQKLVTDANLLNLATFIENALNGFPDFVRHNSIPDILLKNPYIIDFIQEITNCPSYKAQFLDN